MKKTSVKTKQLSLLCAIFPFVSGSVNAAGYEFGRFSFSNLYSKEDKIMAAYNWAGYDIEGVTPQGASTGNVAADTNYIQAAINYHFNDSFSGNIQYYRSQNIDTHHAQGPYQGSGGVCSQPSIGDYC
ncbi:hypothetical protein [Vibrio algicola]|uniref:Uncharacterized protein n=1 Tax=Vibrio algicola TaxID=2662262 RepID=A0A5Q0TGW0_9VIBR|nr:hypothetical protein [Vibrio algicola]